MKKIHGREPKQYSLTEWEHDAGKDEYPPLYTATVLDEIARAHQTLVGTPQKECATSLGFGSTKWSQVCAGKTMLEPQEWRRVLELAKEKYNLTWDETALKAWYANDLKRRTQWLYERRSAGQLKSSAPVAIGMVAAPESAPRRRSRNHLVIGVQVPEPADLDNILRGWFGMAPDAALHGWVKVDLAKLRDAILTLTRE